MNPIVINRNVTFFSGLLYHFLRTYGLMESEHRDICSVTQRFFVGLMMVAVVIVVSIIFGLMIVMPVTWAVWMVFNGWTYPDELTMVTIMGLGLILFFASWMFLSRLVDKKREQDNPGIVISAYRSFKGKYCVPVEFK